MSHNVQLFWEGKCKAASPTPPSLLRVEEWRDQTCTAQDDWQHRLIQGDNLAIMAALCEELAGQFALIYLDPPFFTGVEWTAKRSDGTPALAYSDDWQGDLSRYLQWLYDRLTLCRTLLRDDGVLYLHLNGQAAHYAKLLLDEIFGVARFQNEIVWCYREAINSKKRWNRKHDTLLFYSKGATFTFNADAVRTPYSESNVKKYRHQDEKGAYRLMGRGIKDSPLRSRRDLPSALESDFPELTYRHYLGAGTLPVDWWPIDIENQASPRRTGYPTQKPEALLERILLASTNPGDLIGDFCCGSGTTLAVAQRLNRRWIGCDASGLAIHVTRKRLLAAGVPDFRVEMGTEARLPAAEMPPDAFCLRNTASGVSVQMDTGFAAAVDVWGVQWQPDAVSPALFRPDWWSIRPRGRSGKSSEALQTVSASTASVTAATIQGYMLSGAQFRCQVGC